MNFPEIATLVTDIHFNHFKIDKNFQGIVPVVKPNEDIYTYYDYVAKAVKLKGLDYINLDRLEYEEKFILGRYQKYDDYIHIWVPNRISNCWQRYIAAKELSHLIVDNDEKSYTVDIHTTIEWIIRDHTHKGVNAALDSEHIAAQFAIELLLPYHSTQKMLKDASVPDGDIAEAFKVPLNIIEKIRDQKSKYLPRRDEAYKYTDIKHEVIQP